MSSKQLDSHTANNVRLTLAEIFREDECGEWSFKEIGFRLENSHPDFNSNNHNFNLIDLPRSTNSKNSWEVAVKMLNKNKDHNQIQKVLDFMAERNLFPKRPQAKLG